jgi:hypothetical protein
VVSPNGDGVAETQKLSYKIVRPSNVTVTMTVRTARSPSRTRTRVGRVYDVPFPPVPPAPPERAADADRGAAARRGTLVVDGVRHG